MQITDGNVNIGLGTNMAICAGKLIENEDNLNSCPVNNVIIERITQS